MFGKRMQGQVVRTSSMEIGHENRMQGQGVLRTSDHRGDAEGQVKHAHDHQLPGKLIPGYQDGAGYAKDSIDRHCHC